MMEIFRKLVVVVVMAMVVTIVGCGGSETDPDGKPGYFSISRGERIRSDLAPKGTFVAFTNIKLDYCGEYRPTIQLIVDRTGWGDERAINQIVLIEKPVSTINHWSWVRILEFGYPLSEKGGNKKELIEYTPTSSCARTEVTIAGIMTNNMWSYVGQQVSLTVVGAQVDYGDTYVDVKLPIFGATHTTNASLDWYSTPKGLVLN